MLAGPWQDVLIDQSEDGKLSEEADLGANYEFLTVLIPTITSSAITVHITDTKGGTYYPLFAFDGNATGDFAHATTAATTTHAVVFRIGGVQFIKINSDSAQAADRTFRVRGFNAGF